MIHKYGPTTHSFIARALYLKLDADLQFWNFLLAYVASNEAKKKKKPQHDTWRENISHQQRRTKLF